MTAPFNHIVQLHRQQVSFLAKNYNTLEYSEVLRFLLKQVFCDIDFSGFSKIMLHQYLNDSLLAHYPGEMGLKYQLFRRAAGRKLVAAFETRVENSRLDFLTVNGVSTSFEIKSELDNLDKLSKQVNSYIRVFEFNNVVIDRRHKENALEILPASYGIIYFSNGRHVVDRKALPNTSIDPASQLDMLTKKELRKAFDGLNSRNEIINHYPTHTINEQFKETLKSRYRNRWNFLVEHRNRILPIDLQFFFNRNIDPGIIYNHG